MKFLRTLIFSFSALAIFNTVYAITDGSNSNCQNGFDSVTKAPCTPNPSHNSVNVNHQNSYNNSRNNSENVLPSSHTGTTDSSGRNTAAPTGTTSSPGTTNSNGMGSSTSTDTRSPTETRPHGTNTPTSSGTLSDEY